MTDENKSPTDNLKKLDQEAREIGIGGKLSPEKNEILYKKRMQKRKNIQAKRIKVRKSKKGLFLVFTGNGKGKTTAALGMVLRTIGHGYKVAIIQFIKGGWTTGEAKALKNLSANISFHSLGEGFTPLPTQPIRGIFSLGPWKPGARSRRPMLERLFLPSW